MNFDKNANSNMRNDGGILSLFPCKFVWRQPEFAFLVRLLWLAHFLFFGGIYEKAGFKIYSY